MVNIIFSVRTSAFPDHIGMRDRQRIQEMIDDFMKGRLDPQESARLMKFLAGSPEWFDYFFIELVGFSVYQERQKS